MHVKLCFYSMVRYRVQTTTLCVKAHSHRARLRPSTGVDALKIEPCSILNAFTSVVGRKRAWCTCKRADLLACVPYQRRRASTSVDESEARCATDVYGRRRARCEWALRHYIREVNDSTALEFWQEDEHYHVLSKMARIYSGISPDSVPLKSLFSCAGFMLNSRRSVTAPYKADMVTFVHDNYDVVM